MAYLMRTHRSRSTYKKKPEYRLWFETNNLNRFEEKFSSFQKAYEKAIEMISSYRKATGKNLFVNVESNSKKFYWQFSYDPFRKNCAKEKIYV